MYSFDAFYDLPAGTKFFIRGEWYIKLAPYGGDIGCCALVRLSDGHITHATEQWPMHEYKVDMDVSDIAAFNPKFDKVVETFSWEEHLVEEEDFYIEDPDLAEQAFIDHVNEVFQDFMEDNDECQCEVCRNEDLDDYDPSQSQGYDNSSEPQAYEDESQEDNKPIGQFLTFVGPNFEAYTFETLQEALEHLGVDLPSSHDLEEQERRFLDFRRRMDDQSPELP